MLVRFATAGRIYFWALVGFYGKITCEYFQMFSRLKQKINIKYFMVAYLGLILMYSSFYFYDLERLWKGAVIICLYSTFDLIWTRLRDKVWYVPSSAWISGLILSIVAMPKPSIFWLVFLPLVAVAGKQLLHFGKNRHVYNPASLAMALAAIFVPAITWWALTSGGIIWLLLVGGIFILWKQSRWHVAVSFFISYAVGLLVVATVNKIAFADAGQIIISQFTEPTTIFFASVMLVEPITSGFPIKRQRIIYGTFVGLAVALMTYLTMIFNWPFQDPRVYGLLAGNLLASLLFLPALQPSSYWFKDVADKRRFPSLQGDKNVDVVIIGGGIAGISSAYFLAKAGVKVALLEMGNIASGDSGYSTVMATHFLDSVDVTIKAWDASQAGVSLLKEIINKERINCDWQWVDGVCFANSDLPEFEKNVAALRAKDPGVKYLDKDTATAAVGVPVAAAYRKKGSEGQFHIRKFLLALAKRAAKNGALIFEDTEALDIRLGNSVAIKTAKGIVTAKWLVVATGMPPAKIFPEVAGKLSAAVTYVINAKFADSKIFPRNIFWDNLDPYHYFRWVNKNELVCGGQDWQMNEPKPKIDPHAALENWLNNFCGQQKKFKVINKWQGSIFCTPDILPYIGPHSAYGSNVIFLTGWAGNGIAHGFLAGNIAADMIQNKPNLHQSIFSFNR